MMISDDPNVDLINQEKLDQVAQAILKKQGYSITDQRTEGIILLMGGRESWRYEDALSYARIAAAILAPDT